MKILHTSDQHGRFDPATAPREFDLWIDTGDFFPNVSRDRRIEPAFQTHWAAVTNIADNIVQWLDDRPVVTVPGNHDFVTLYDILSRAGYENVHKVTPEGVEVSGLRFAGFREVNWLGGDWEGEVQSGDFSEIVTRTLESNPDVLVTHAPPYNILDGPEVHHYGIPAISTALTYQEHSVRAHFFGHMHMCGGCNTEKMEVRFFNGANNAIVHELNVDSSEDDSDPEEQQFARTG